MKFLVAAFYTYVFCSNVLLLIYYRKVYDAAAVLINLALEVVG